MKNVIMAISIDKRSTSAATVQNTLTKYGELIQVRLGIHDLHQGEENGRILLQLFTDDAKLEELTAALSALDMVSVQSMVLK